MLLLKLLLIIKYCKYLNTTAIVTMFCYSSDSSDVSDNGLFVTAVTWSAWTELMECVEEECAHNPPPSLVPRLHVVHTRKLVHNNPLSAQCAPDAAGR